MTKADGELEDVRRVKLARKLCVLRDLFEVEGASVLTYPQFSQYLRGKGIALSRSRWAYMRSGEGSLAADKELLQSLPKFFRVDSRDLLDEGYCVYSAMDVRLSAQEEDDA